jgi:hypothetical protein
VDVSMTRLTRILGSAAITLLLFGPLVAALFQRVPNRIDRALANDRTGVASHPVDLVHLSGDTTDTRVVPLWRVGPGDLSGADTLQLLLATYATAPQLQGAEFRVGSCLFLLAAPMTVRDDTEVVLHRQGPCVDDNATTALLTIEAHGPGRLAWWTWEMPAKDNTEWHGLTMTAPEHPGPTRSVVRGRWARDLPGPGPRRLAILAWLHDLPGSHAAAVLFGVLTGLFLLSTYALTSARPVGVVAGAVGGALSLAVAWALVLPPLQGPDEPDHLLSAAEVTAHPTLAEALPALARRVHFERVRFHRDEKFRPTDQETPFPVAWTGDVHSERMENRSPLGAAFWRWTAPGADATPAQVLMHMRLVNALLFALCVGLAVWLVRQTIERSGAWPLVGATLMPTVPYFGTMVSDWAVLTAGTVGLGAGIVVLLHGQARNAWAGPAIGLSAAIMLATGMAALPMVVLVATLLLGHLLVGHSRRHPLVFWGGILLGGLVAWWWLANVATVGFQRYDAAARPNFQRLLEWTNGALAVFGSAPWAPVLLAAGGVVLDRGLHAWRSSAWLLHAAPTFGRALAGVVTIGAGLQLVTSVFITFPQLAAIDVRPPSSPFAYVWMAGTPLLTAARMTSFDQLSFASLWGGFGWLDAMLPPPFFMVITVALSAMWIAIWRASAPRAAALTPFLVLGALLAAAGTLAATAFMGRNLHGRYLLPVVVPVVIALASTAGQWLATQPRASLRWTVGAGIALLHGSSLVWVLLRYI